MDKVKYYVIIFLVKRKKCSIQKNECKRYLDKLLAKTKIFCHFTIP